MDGWIDILYIYIYPFYPKYADIECEFQHSRQHPKNTWVMRTSRTTLPEAHPTRCEMDPAKRRLLMTIGKPWVYHGLPGTSWATWDFPWKSDVCLTNVGPQSQRPPLPRKCAGADELYKTLMKRTENVQRVFTGQIPQLITMTSNLVMNIGHLEWMCFHPPTRQIVEQWACIN